MLKSLYQPCIPTRGTRVPANPDWLHEIKHDGYRLIVQRDGKRVRLFTRNGYDWSDRYPLITEAVLSASTAMPGIGLPVHVPDMFARKARCAQVECKSNDRNRIQKLQKWPGWRCHAEQAGVFRRGVRTPFSG